jgi:hypothetical protein
MRTGSRAHARKPGANAERGETAVRTTWRGLPDAAHGISGLIPPATGCVPDFRSRPLPGRADAPIAGRRACRFIGNMTTARMRAAPAPASGIAMRPPRRDAGMGLRVMPEGAGHPAGIAARPGRCAADDRERLFVRGRFSGLPDAPCSPYVPRGTWGVTNRPGCSICGI